jgi:hypothetical protein
MRTPERMRCLGIRPQAERPAVRALQAPTNGRAAEKRDELAPSHWLALRLGQGMIAGQPSTPEAAACAFRPRSSSSRLRDHQPERLGGLKD